MLDINITFDGFWRETNKAWITPCAGIYCVYACTYLSEVGKVRLDELLYIGQSVNVNARIMAHEKIELWKSCINPFQELCYSVAEVVQSHLRDVCEAVLIYNAQPRCNDMLTGRYYQEAVKISLDGKIGLLSPYFQVTPS